MPGEARGQSRSTAAEVLQVCETLGVCGDLITGTELLSGSHGHRVWRIHCDSGPFVVKWFPGGSSAATEIGAYRLLQELAVPTLPVYGITNQALLLADLGSSPQWRLASEEDVANPEVGSAVGRWYRLFHQRGLEFCQSSRQEHAFLKRETAILEAQAIHRAAKALGLAGNPVWEVAIEALPALKRAESNLSTTLNYNDFYWTNLALTRGGSASLEAVVFDYHLLGVGMPYSDCRNVTGSLGPKAVVAFWDEYGWVDPKESVIDRPLSTLHALVVAAGRPRFPDWAQDSRDMVTNGRLLCDLREAISLAEELDRKRG